MDNSTRRRFLRMSGIAGAIGLTGCSSSLGGSSSTPTPANKDTDGDGVINSEDYAPRDASVQRAEQVQEVDSTATAPEQQTPNETPTEQPPTETPQADTTVWDFESGDLDEAWRNEIDTSTYRSGIDGGRKAYTVQSETAPEGDYALRGDQALGRDGTSTILRDDFTTISTDGATVSLYVKLGPVLSGAERANQVEFLKHDEEKADGKLNGYQPVIILDQKDRPGKTSKARIGNRNTPNSDLSSVKLVKIQDINFSNNEVGSVRVAGEEVATSLAFLRDASEICAVRVKQGHFAQPANIVVDKISLSPGG